MSVELIKTKSDEELNREKALRELTKSFFGIEKPLKDHINYIASLEDLISHLHAVFSSDYVNIELVNHLLMVYTSNYNDWKKFGKFYEYKINDALNKKKLFSIAKFDRYR